MSGSISGHLAFNVFPYPSCSFWIIPFAIRFSAAPRSILALNFAADNTTGRSGRSSVSFSSHVQRRTRAEYARLSRLRTAVISRLSVSRSTSEGFSTLHMRFEYPIESFPESDCPNPCNKISVTSTKRSLRWLRTFQNRNTATGSNQRCVRSGKSSFTSPRETPTPPKPGVARKSNGTSLNPKTT